MTYLDRIRLSGNQIPTQIIREEGVLGVPIAKQFVVKWTNKKPDAEMHQAF